MLARSEALQVIFSRHGDRAIYVTSTGFISRAVSSQFEGLSGQVFFMQGSMGLAPLNTEKDVVVINGDGGLLMHLGSTHTIRDSQCDNLYHYVLDNGCHESVGGYRCSPLESQYPGVTEIFKISCDGKMSRVGVDCHDNADQIKGVLCDAISLL